MESVSCEPTSAPLPDAESPSPVASDEVATDESPLVPLPYSSWLELKDVWPVPPEGTVRALANVSAPIVEKLDVAVPPKEALLKRPELTNREDVVACVSAESEVMSAFAPLCLSLTSR